MGVFSIGLTTVSAQIGINTTEPRTALEVAGNTKVTTFEVREVNDLEENQVSTFLTQDTNGVIRPMRVSNLTETSLGYIQEYKLYNPDDDWVADFNTNIPANQYDVIVISAHYDREVGSDDSRVSFSIPSAAATVKDGTWRLLADYPGFANVYSSAGTWTITTLIFSKDLSKNLGNPTVNMGGNQTGAANNPIID